MASKPVVGFIGLDELSLELAASLLRSGYSVQAFEVVSSVVDEFSKLGGVRCADLVEAGKGAAAVVILISSVDQVNDLFLGPNGALKGLNKDAIIILHSTISHVHIQKLERSLTEVSKIASVVDVYVSRGVSEGLDGKIMAISSGCSDSVSMAQPILSAMCDKLYVFEGELGAGSKVKMVIDLLEGIHFVASVEAISLGAQAGIHPWILYDIISNAAGNSWVFKNYLPQLLKGNPIKQHFINTIAQTLGTVLDMAKSLTFPLLLLAVAHQQVIAGSRSTLGDDDASLLKVWEKVLGVNILDAANAETYNPEQLANDFTAKSKPVKKIGFIGLGAMGFGMATHLLRSNFSVHGFDVILL